MKYLLALVGAAALAGCASVSAPEPAARSDAEGPPPVRVMVVGTYHMAGSSADVVNVEVDDVLAPERQRELAALAAALASFRPTAIAIERIAEAPGYVDPNFANFSDDALASNPNERVQVGYRLAKVAGVDRVYGVDEMASADEPDYFPFGDVVAIAARSGRSGDLNRIIGDVQSKLKEFEASQPEKSIAELLRFHNEALGRDHSFYFALSAFDVGEDQPGAELQAYWFMRNAKIFSKIMQVTKPGDRIVVLYGSGHKYWLDHFARETPGYELVDPLPYLKAAAGD
ncbi:MAG: hypothetical protein GC152_09230 [Alphaproteobacteria bacterium]|nr:hypothetical protein [Alphaproteobacteria bacterium]